MDSKTAINLLKTGSSNVFNIGLLTEKSIEIADFIEQQEKQIKETKEILQDVLSDCYLSDGMRSEIERLVSDDK